MTSLRSCNTENTIVIIVIMDVSLFIGNIFHDFVCGGVWARIVESEWFNNGDGFTRRQHGSQFLRLVKGSGEQCGLSWKVFFHYDIIIVVTVLNRTKIASLWRSLPTVVKPDSSVLEYTCTRSSSEKRCSCTVGYKQGSLRLEGGRG